MTKEELKQKCTERAKIFQQAMESCHSSSPMDCIEWFADRIADLEAQIEKMKCCGNCSHFRLDKSGLYPIYVCELTYPNRCKNHEKWEIKEK